MAVISEINTAMVSLSQMQPFPVTDKYIWILPRRPDCVPLGISRTVWCGDNGRSGEGMNYKNKVVRSLWRSFLLTRALWESFPSFGSQAILDTSEILTRTHYILEMHREAALAKWAEQLPVPYQSPGLFGAHENSLVWPRSSESSKTILSKSHHLSVLLHLENVFLRVRLVRWSGG